MCSLHGVNEVKHLHVTVLMHGETISKLVKVGYNDYRHCRYAKHVNFELMSCFIPEGFHEGS